jgi:hypothetical protein
VGGAGARSTLEGGRLQVQDAIVAVLAEDRLGAHDEPDLELDIGDRRVDALRTALRYDARGIGRIGLLNVSRLSGRRSAS